MCMTPEKGTKFFKSLVDNLVQLDQVKPKEEDGIYAGYKQCLEMVVMKNKRENRLDKFFFSDIGGLSGYPKQSKIIKMILVLFHRQGCIE